MTTIGFTTIKKDPAALKHLYNLITDTSYRKKASSAKYPAGRGQNHPGGSVTKFGYTITLPAGIEQKIGRFRYVDPGKYRFGYSQKGQAMHWYMMEHLGVNNEYKFKRITFKHCKNISCKKGLLRKEIVCPECKGTGQRYEHGLYIQCKCRKTGGIIQCPECKDYEHYANGFLINTDKNVWGIR